MVGVAWVGVADASFAIHYCCQRTAAVARKLPLPEVLNLANTAFTAGAAVAAVVAVVAVDTESTLHPLLLH